jgi:sugar lactone lactonase YvrE
VRRYVSTPATTERAEHAEGPSWDARTGQLVYVDQFDGLVHIADYDATTAQLTTTRTYELGSAVGAVVPTIGSGWLVACGQGFARLETDGEITKLAQPGSPDIRMNDGKCDDQGRFWAGSMAWAKTTGGGSLYRLDPDLNLTVALSGVTISNGLAWTDDNDTMYYIDTPTGQVERFRVCDDGSLVDRTAAITVEGGYPDGMCIDGDGCLWVAVWGGHAVHRYAPSGELLAVVEVDAPQVSSCCLGGADGRTLFITTSQEGMDVTRRVRHPQSGKVFCVDVDSPGRPAAMFGAA